jgi:hypothetical protein
MMNFSRHIAAWLLAIVVGVGGMVVVVDAQGVHPDIVYIKNVTGRIPGGVSWADSYSVGSECYCYTNFDHNIGTVVIPTGIVGLGNLTVKQICDRLGAGPGIDGRPIYNDIQCGNGPANDAGDEVDCPGRVDIGIGGCGHIGPQWNLQRLVPKKPPGSQWRMPIRKCLRLAKIIQNCPCDNDALPSVVQQCIRLRSTRFCPMPPRAVNQRRRKWRRYQLDLYNTYKNVKKNECAQLQQLP